MSDTSRIIDSRCTAAASPSAAANRTSSGSAGAIRGVVFAAAGTGFLSWATSDVLSAATAPGAASFQDLLVATAAGLAWFLFGWLLLAGVAVVASAAHENAGSRRARHHLAALVLRLTPAAGQRVAALVLGIALLPSALPTAASADHGPGGRTNVSSRSSTCFDRPAAAPTDSSSRTDARTSSVTTPRDPRHTARHVEVRRGDSLWSLAAHHLAVQQPAADAAADVAAADIAAEWQSWYAANRSTIGPDPDLIRPGQLLRVPPNRLHSQSSKETS